LKEGLSDDIRQGGDLRDKKDMIACLGSFINPIHKRGVVTKRGARTAKKGKRNIPLSPLEEKRRSIAAFLHFGGKKELGLSILREGKRGGGSNTKIGGGGKKKPRVNFIGGEEFSQLKRNLSIEGAHIPAQLERWPRRGPRKMEKKTFTG